MITINGSGHLSDGEPVERGEDDLIYMIDILSGQRLHPGYERLRCVGPNTYQGDTGKEIREFQIEETGNEIELVLPILHCAEILELSGNKKQVRRLVRKYIHSGADSNMIVEKIIEEAPEYGIEAKRWIAEGANQVPSHSEPF